MFETMRTVIVVETDDIVSLGIFPFKTSVMKPIYFGISTDVTDDSKMKKFPQKMFDL